MTRLNGRIRSTLAVGLALSLSTIVRAQERFHDDVLTVIDQTIGDVSPLGVSLRHIQPGLHQPAGFANVYRVPGQADMLMRVNGGLYAVFPQSTYAMSEGGPVAQIPASTTFYIGTPPPAKAETTAPLPDGVTRLDSRVDLRRSAEVPGERPIARVADEMRPVSRRPQFVPSPEVSLQGRGPAIVTDAAYRTRRLRSLLAAAAKQH